jgi:hypothetical protein
MKMKILRKLWVLGAVFMLVGSYFTAIIVRGETINGAAILSAKIITDDSEQPQLLLDVTLTNQSNEPLKKTITMDHAKLKEVAEKQEGYAYQVKNNTLYLTIEPQRNQTIQLTLPVEKNSLLTEQAPELVYDGHRQAISVVIPQAANEKTTEVSTDTLEETASTKETTTTETNPAESEAPKTVDSTNKSETLAESTETKGPEVSEEPTAADEVIKPFSFPSVSADPVFDRSHKAIMPQYTTDASGTYPTASWQPTGNQNVRNHQGNKDGTAQWDGQKEWNGDPTNKTNSYIEYGGTGTQADYAIRKYAKETTTPGLFDVYLNIRGNVQKEIAPLDLVLVVDWSGSMNDNNRIGEVQKGVDRFVDTLAESGISDNIHMGYVGYSSDGYKNDSVAMGPFDSVKNAIKTITPSSTTGGTFTQKALRDAGNMLATPNGHKKVIVLLTDGVPTFSYQVSKVQTEANGSYYGTQFTNRQDQPGSTSRISNSYYAPDQRNTNKLINSTFIATIGEAMALKQRGIEIHGLGIQLQSDPNAGLSKQEVENKMRQMVSADENGDLYYESADHAPDISDYLARKAIQISGTVANGKVTDPIAEPFRYEPNTLTVKSVGSLQVQTMPTLSLEGTTVHSNEIYLGKDQEIQIHYQVRIQTESATFKPDFWYPMNGRTTFQPVATADEVVDFGVPSGKAPGVKLDFKKIWEEFDHDPSSRPENVIYEVSRKQVTDTASWQTGYLKILQPLNDTGNLWERTGVTQLSMSAEGAYAETLSLPKYNNRGQNFSYQTTRELAVPGYEQEKVDETTWKNTKQFQPLALKVIKNSSTGEKNLVGAVFELTGKNGRTTLIDNQDGTYSLPQDVRLQKGEIYTLTEVQAPAGHERGKTTWQIEVTSEGRVTIDGEEVSTEEQVITLTVVNPFSELPIGIRKYTLQAGNQVNLSGATFSLQKKNTSEGYQTIATEKTDDSGVAHFIVDQPGQYRMVEDSGPLGYDTIAGNYEFTVDKYGKIHYDGKNVDQQSKEWTLNHQNQLKAFDLTVHKKADDQTPLKGATFRLTGPNTDIERAGEETDTFVFEQLQPGKYTLTETFTPEGYQGLKAPIEIVINEDGSVWMDGEEVTDVLVAGEKNNQIVFDVTNRAKVPLPETGGDGRLGIYLIAISSIAIAGIYLYFQRLERKV